MAIVGPTGEPDPVHGVALGSGVAVEVIELKAAALWAALAARIDEGAPAAVSLEDRAPDRRGDVARLGTLGR